MTIRNADIADMLDELADLLEIEDANPFRVRAYRNAANTVRGQSRSMAELVAADEPLSKLPGVGKDIGQKIRTIVETGRLPLLDEVAARTPRALSRLMSIEGLGPKRVKTLHEALDVGSAEDLAQAVREQRIRELPGFGERLERLIGERIAELAGCDERTELALAEQIALPLVEHLRATEGIGEITIAGSYRRRCETVGDLDILTSARNASKIMQRFVAYGDVRAVVSQGTTRSTVHLATGMQIDLRVVRKVGYGAALHYFTGSKAHNIATRRIAVRKGYKLNEYGVFDGDERVAGKTERAVYEKLGLAFVPPELRENRGEIRAARDGTLPRLVDVDDLQGDLRCQAEAGRGALERLAAAAAELGYEYVAIDAGAGGAGDERTLQQIRAIDAFNAKHARIRLLKTLAVPILESGGLGLSKRVRDALDFTVCAVHERPDLPRRRQTERVLRAMDDPRCSILAYPVDARAAYQIDLEKVLAGAAERGCVLELDARHGRSGLSDDACRQAKRAGARVAIASGAGDADDLPSLRFGVYRARRGWLERGDVINTLELDALLELLRR